MPACTARQKCIVTCAVVLELIMLGGGGQAAAPTFAMDMVCCSITSWMAVRSASAILSNSSMQHTPRSARTKAPPSRVISPVRGSRITAAVRPTPDEPRPVVYWPGDHRNRRLTTHPRTFHIFHFFFQRNVDEMRNRKTYSWEPGGRCTTAAETLLLPGLPSSRY